MRAWCHHPTSHRTGGAFKAKDGKYTLIRLKLDTAAATPVAKGKKVKEPEEDAAPSTLHPEVRALVELMFAEAKAGLLSSIDANITENGAIHTTPHTTARSPLTGIETPLGVLSQEQVTKGDDILQQIIKTVTDAPGSHAKLQDLSSQFFTNIPHRFGRARPPVISDMAMIKAEGVRAHRITSHITHDRRTCLS